jgi:hypothetical protein
MQDQPSAGDIGAHDEVERVVLELCCSTLGLRGRGRCRSSRLQSGARCTQILPWWVLHAAGLVHRCHECVWRRARRRVSTTRLPKPRSAG